MKSTRYGWLFLYLIVGVLACSRPASHPLKAQVKVQVKVQANERAKRPNVVFILVDDLGWVDLGCYGSEFHQTPNIDRLAKSGMRFTDAYASGPVCSPTRASIMTGKYPARVNITDWIPGGRAKHTKLKTPQDIHQLPHEEVTIAEVLRDKGYRTFFAGKWHLGSEGFYPEDQGFETNKGGHNRGSPPGGYYSPYKNPKLTDGPEGEYLPDRLTDESLRFLDANSENPFLLYVSFYTVHSPIQACKRHIEASEERASKLTLDGPATVRERNGVTRLHQNNAPYASMVSGLDDNVGRLLDKLDELGIDDNTIVVLTSDNGGLSTLKNAGPTSNVPLRAGKGWCYEGGIRVPLIVRAPGVTRLEGECDVPVTSTDFYPTLLELTGLEQAPEQHADGVSIVPLLKGESKLAREAIYWHFPHYHGSTWAPGAAIRVGDWKLIEFYEEERAELYNLKSDISERYDLSRARPEKAEELLTMLNDWQKKIGAKMPVPNDDESPQ